MSKLHRSFAECTHNPLLGEELIERINISGLKPAHVTFEIRAVAITPVSIPQLELKVLSLISVRLESKYKAENSRERTQTLPRQCNSPENNTLSKGSQAAILLAP